jgi:hypothetical protein
MVTPTPAPIAEVASQRLIVVHGSIEWTQALTPDQMLRRGWFVRGKNHDPTNWSYLVWMITKDNPLCKLAADTVANQGSDRKELASMEAPGATTHVCMWLDPSTKKPCGHSFCLKPKNTRAASARKSDESFSVFSPHCNSVQSSNVTAACSLSRTLNRSRMLPVRALARYSRLSVD